MASSPTVSLARPTPPRPAAGSVGVVRWLRLFGAGIEWLFGTVSLLVGLAVLAAIPVLQVLAYGYLLEVSGRIARTGRMSAGFIGIRTAARIGQIVWGAWLLVLPVRVVADLAAVAALIDPGSATARQWRFGLIVLVSLTTVHAIASVARGGRLIDFARPWNGLWFLRQLRAGGFYTQARDRVWDGVVSLRLPYYFWLGLRGLVATLVWLVPPVSLWALWSLGRPATTLLSLIGAAALALVLLVLPFLQVQLARDNDLRSAFRIGSVRRMFARAPWAFLVAFVATLLLAIPLYLLKIEVVPREAAWLPGLVFLVFIVPAKFLLGWAVARAGRREQPRHSFWRWSARLPLIPVLGLYLLVVFFSQYTSWMGIVSLFEQHAFVLPIPRG